MKKYRPVPKTSITAASVPQPPCCTNKPRQYLWLLIPQQSLIGPVTYCSTGNDSDGSFSRRVSKNPGLKDPGWAFLLLLGCLIYTFFLVSKGPIPRRNAVKQNFWLPGWKRGVKLRVGLVTSDCAELFGSNYSQKGNAVINSATNVCVHVCVATRQPLTVINFGNWHLNKQ